jgi:hypothetical protein
MAMTGDLPRRPSPRVGWTRALALWRLVLACWIVSWVAVAPALLVIRLTVFRALASLPPDPASVPSGDLQLIVAEAGRYAVGPLGLAVVSAMAVMWAWTVLWHAGVVGWQLWTGGRRVRLGEVLGLGMVAWWRYARLSLTAAAVGSLAIASGLIPIWSGIRTAFHEMAEERMMVLAGAGLAAVVVVTFGVWLATLHAAWLLGLPERRSAFLAWFAGLWSAIRTPFSSLGAWLLWVVPALVVSAVPFLVGLNFPEARGTPILIGVSLATSLVRSFCFVGLFVSFAPITGLLAPPGEEQ